MTLLGIPVGWPTNRALVACLSVILFFSSLLAVLYSLGLVSGESLKLSVAGIAAGTLSNAFGISVPDYGWRAIVLLFVLSTILWTPMILVGY